MENIQGVHIEGFSIESYRKVSDLIYFEGPLLTHFLSNKNENFLFNWVDSSDYLNRWFIFRVSQDKLVDYLSGKIPLLNFFKDPIDGFIYKIDLSEEGVVSEPMLVFSESIPQSYFPANNSFYSFTPENQELDLSYYSKKHEAGILQAYFQNPSIVPYNEIDFSLFAKSLYEMNSVFEAMSDSYLKIRIASAPVDSKGKKIIDRNLVKKSTQLNYFAQAGGSFSALFKSSLLEVPMQGFKTDEDSFIEFVMLFFKASEDPSQLSETVQKVDRKTIIHYKNLLNTILKSKLNFYFKYENHRTNVRFRQNLSFKKADLIIRNIENLEYDFVEEIRIVGQYIALNIRTGTYTFEEVGENKTVSRGRLDRDRLEMAWIIKFNKTYEVVIKREESKPIGRKNAKIINTIVSVVELDDLLYD
jgi:hypothetical protein